MKAWVGHKTHKQLLVRGYINLHRRTATDPTL